MGGKGYHGPPPSRRMAAFSSAIRPRELISDPRIIFRMHTRSRSKRSIPLQGRLTRFDMQDIIPEFYILHDIVAVFHDVMLTKWARAFM